MKHHDDNRASSRSPPYRALVGRISPWNLGPVAVPVLLGTTVAIAIAGQFMIGSDVARGGRKAHGLATGKTR